MNAQLLAEADCVLLAMDHSQFDYDFVGRYAQLIVDTRSAMADFSEYEHKIWKA